jgi:hypothetical protein
MEAILDLFLLVVRWVLLLLVCAFLTVLAVEFKWVFVMGARPRPEAALALAFTGIAACIAFALLSVIEDKKHF